MHNAEFFIAITNKSLMLVLLITAPPVLASLTVGLIISVFQATTQIQEQTLTFVPKLVTVIVTLMFMGPQMLEQVLTFANELLTQFPSVIH